MHRRRRWCNISISVLLLSRSGLMRCTPAIARMVEMVLPAPTSWKKNCVALRFFHSASASWAKRRIAAITWWW